MKPYTGVPDTDGVGESDVVAVTDVDGDNDGDTDGDTGDGELDAVVVTVDAADGEIDDDTATLAVALTELLCADTRTTGRAQQKSRVAAEAAANGTRGRRDVVILAPRVETRAAAQPVAGGKLNKQT